MQHRLSSMAGGAGTQPSTGHRAIKTRRTEAELRFVEKAYSATRESISLDRGVSVAYFHLPAASAVLACAGVYMLIGRRISQINEALPGNIKEPQREALFIK